MNRCMSDHDAAPVGRHGVSVIDGVRVDNYNLPLRDDEGFVGDKARCKAFAAALDTLRAERRKAGPDPLAGIPSDDRKTLDGFLDDGGSEAEKLILDAVDTFATRLAEVAARFLKTEEWLGTHHIVVGGGLRESGIGELAIRRANALLSAEGIEVVLRPIRGDPDEAALLGAARLCPPAMRDQCEAILAVDIGGSNIRAGVVLLNLGLARDLSKSEVVTREHWCHRAESVGRDEAVERLNGMLTKLIRQASGAGVSLAPFVGIGCPGQIGSDGTIACGGQNLPGEWEEEGFQPASPGRCRTPNNR